ncbi:hypothetical protein KFK09_012947 [Dendrobium nobile]|uniref:Poly(A) RNA polymerase mitochondrial-like central palm domain-containing protein n=1 Tax=Dendrobium nobile TaxID=94219 RepID=A0A8T3BM98_DENNO|nr:hypothetical protein KFK09_012947 [Dendrobium nobile]
MMIEIIIIEWEQEGEAGGQRERGGWVLGWMGLGWRVGSGRWSCGVIWVEKMADGGRTRRSWRVGGDLVLGGGGRDGGWGGRRVGGIVEEVEVEGKEEETKRETRNPPVIIGPKSCGELGLCASIFEGSWISKMWGSKVGNMSVEDFLDRSQILQGQLGNLRCPRSTIVFAGHSSIYLVPCKEETKHIVNLLRPSVDTITKTNLANNNMAMTLKRNLPSKRKLAIEITPKRARHAKAAGSFKLWFSSEPIYYLFAYSCSNPALPPPQPINGVGHPHVSFESSGYLSHSNSNHPFMPIQEKSLWLSFATSCSHFLIKGKGHLSGVLPILQARVPVLKAVDCRTGIECDISVENKDGISRSLFFSIVSSIDERFRIMSYLMKAWAKANDINSSKDHTINSLSIISLVAFHFQTRDPPILPPFSTLLKDGTDITNLRNVVLALKNFGRRNKESVAELFVALLAKLSSVEKLWELGLCASIFEGSWISKMWGSKVGNMSVEDFLDRSQNFARSVGKFEMPKIYNCLRGSLEHLSRSMQGQIEFSALRPFLFGSFSFNAQINHINKSAMIVNKNLPIQSVQPIADNINKSNHDNRRKQTYSESAQASVDTITTTNLANNNMAMTLKRNLPSKRKLAIEITPKRARHAKAAGASSYGSHQNQSTTYLPIPVVYPALPPPQPINGVGHPHVSFETSGYLSHSNSNQPIYANTGHGPHHNHLIYASQYHPTAPVHLAYGSQRPQYFPNPVHPIFPWHTVHNTGQPRPLDPPRWFGPNHL